MDNNLSITYKKAAINKTGLDLLLAKVAQRTHAKVITNFKNPDTTVDKVERKNEAKPSRKYGLEDVNDVARGRLVYQSIDALHKGVEALKGMVKRTPLKIAKTEDFFKNPEDGGYRGYHVDLEFPNKQVVEIQLHTPQSYAATLVTHPEHESYGENLPEDVEKSKKNVSDQIMKLPTKEAEKLSAEQEQQTLPAMIQAQLKAGQQIQSPLEGQPQQPQMPQIPNRGNPNAAIAPILPSTG